VEERILLQLCCSSVAALLQLCCSCSMLEVARRSGREDAVAVLLQLCCSIRRDKLKRVIRISKPIAAAGGATQWLLQLCCSVTQRLT
jgi:hypothetical protein